MSRSGGEQSASAMAAFLAQQVAFYDEDAGPYQAWLDHLRDESNVADEATEFRRQERWLDQFLTDLAPLGRVIELAAGTGRVSRLVAPHASELTLVDSSPKSLALARGALLPYTDRVTAIEADLFGWEPLDATFDLVLFAAWLHHVPRERFEGFWKMVDRLVAPGGSVAFDFAVAGSRVHVAVPPAVPSDGYGVYHDPARHLSVRDLHGRRWKVVHEPWEPGDLVERLNRLGWDVDIRSEIGGTSRWAVASR